MSFLNQKTIYCIGSIIMDISIECPRFPNIGETLYTPFSYNLTPGGKGANQAVAASRLGGKVKMLGRLSTDNYGQILENNLKNAGVDIEYVTKDNTEKSGVAFVWIDQTGKNKIICSPGVNMNNLFKDFEKALNHISPGDIIILTLELPKELFNQTVKLVKEKKGFLIVDPSGGDYSYLTPELLSQIDLMKPNEIEAEYLTGIKLSDYVSMKNAVKAIHEMGVSYPLISLGEKGVIYEYQNTIKHISGIKVHAIDTTAAGDTFIGAFAAKKSQGFSIEESIAYGNLAASICVQRHGAQDSIPYKDEILF